MLEGQKSGVRGLAVSGDGQHVVSGSIDRTLRIWDFDPTTASWTAAGDLVGHTGNVWSVAFSSDGERVISGSLKRHGKEIFTLQERHVRYWMSQPVPVYLVIASSQRVIRWMEVSSYLKKKRASRPDTERDFGANFEREDGATQDRQTTSGTVGAYNGAARHASETRESRRTRHVAWPSLARTGRPGVWAR